MARAIVPDEWFFSAGTYRRSKTRFCCKHTHRLVYDWHTFYGSDGAENRKQHFCGWRGEYFHRRIQPAKLAGRPEHPTPHAHSGSWDLTLTKTNSSGVYQWHTFFPGASVDPAYVVAVYRRCQR